MGEMNRCKEKARENGKEGKYRKGKGGKRKGKGRYCECICCGVEDIGIVLSLMISRHTGGL